MASRTRQGARVIQRLAWAALRHKIICLPPDDK
jgi:hypothetical protein